MMDILYIQRFRDSTDRSSVVECACDVFGVAVARNVSMHSHPPIRLTEKVNWYTRVRVPLIGDTDCIPKLYTLVRVRFHAHLEKISITRVWKEGLPLCIL